MLVPRRLLEDHVRTILLLLRLCMVRHHHLLICYGCCIEAVTVAHIHLAFAQVAELGVRTASRVILLRSLDSSMLLNCADALVLLCVRRFLLFELRVWWMQLSRHR